MARRSRREWQNLLARWDKAIADAFLEAIAEVTNNVTLKAVSDALAAGDLDRAVQTLQIEGAAFRALDEAVRQAYISGAVDAAASIPVLRDGTGARVVFRFDVRAPSAEAWLREHSLTRLVEEELETIRAALVSGMERGQNPRQAALDIVGRLDRVSNRRVGGVIGLTGPQKHTMDWVRAGFAESDPEALSRYLGLKARDRRFDRIIEQAISDGKLAKADADRISGRLADRYLKLRGDMIGRTESLAALNGGRTEAFRQAAGKAGVDGMRITRVWSATGDARVRDSHREMDGQTVRGLNTPFVAPSGARMMHPGDSSLGASGADVIQCRCRVNLRVDWFGGRA